MTRRGGAAHTTARRWDRGLEDESMKSFASTQGSHLVSRHTPYHQEELAATALPEKAEEIWHARQNSERLLLYRSRVWNWNCTAQDRKPLQYVIKTAQSISWAAFTLVWDIYPIRVIRRAHSITRDCIQSPTHCQTNLQCEVQGSFYHRQLSLWTPVSLSRTPSYHSELVYLWLRYAHTWLLYPTAAYDCCSLPFPVALLKVYLKVIPSYSFSYLYLSLFKVE